MNGNGAMAYNNVTEELRLARQREARAKEDYAAMAANLRSLRSGLKALAQDATEEIPDPPDGSKTEAFHRGRLQVVREVQALCNSLFDGEAA